MKIETRADGYERVRSWEGGRDVYAYIHQLVMVAEGEDPAKIFSGGLFHIHHKNGVKWDNRPENLELVDNRQHPKIHAKA